MPRFLLTEEPDEDGEVRIVGDDARHLSGPLRARPGETIALCRPGRWLSAVVEQVGKSRIVARVTADVPAPEEPEGPALLAALPAREAWEWILEKATELGAGRIQPVLTERSAVFRDRAGGGERLARWQRIVEEARKQCGRTRPPELGLPVGLSQVLDRPWDRLIVLDGAGAMAPPSPVGPSGATALLIGPEGGLTPAESEAAATAGATAWSLGRFVLRAETAAVAALAALNASDTANRTM